MVNQIDKSTVNEEIGNRELTYRQLVKRLPFPVCICNLNGKILDFNDHAVELWGRTPDEKDLWTGAWRLYSANGRLLSRDESPLARCANERRDLTQEVIVEQPEGQQYHIIVDVSLLYGDRNDPVGVMATLKEVIDRRQWEERVAHLAAIITSSDDAIVSKTLGGIVKSWNRAAEQMFGFTEEEMVGQSIKRIIPKHMWMEEDEILRRIRQGERIQHFETQRQMKTGRLLDISLSISPIKNSKGEIIGASKIARDISEQKRTGRRIEESEARLRMSIEATGLGTWELIPETGRMDISQECRQIFNFPVHAPVNFQIFSRRLFSEDAEQLKISLAENEHSDQEKKLDIYLRIMRQDDHEVRWIRMQGRRFMDKSSASRFIGTILDVTDDRLAKQELEKIIRERTKELRRVNAELIQSNKELEQFAYVASHDLQEPLRKINSFGDILKTKYSSSLEESALDLIGRMQSASGRMKRLMDGLLSYSRVSHNPEPFELLDLNDVIFEVQEDMETSVLESGAKFKVGRLFPIEGHPLQIRQLFQNLFGNSLKFRHPSKDPIIEVKSKVVRGSELPFKLTPKEMERTFQLIEVRDNGIGFEQEYADRIFRLFERLHGRSAYPGSGMGLSIVKKVVANHSGYIMAKSHVGTGSVFTIVFPMVADTRPDKKDF